MGEDILRLFPSRPFLFFHFFFFFIKKKNRISGLLLIWICGSANADIRLKLHWVRGGNDVPRKDFCVFEMQLMKVEGRLCFILVFS